MRVALLAVILVVTACAPASPRAQSSAPPTAIPTVTSSPNPTLSPAPTPTRVPGSPLSWAAPVLVDHQPPFEGNGMNSISCPTVHLCVAVEYSNVITSSNPTGGAGAWTVTNVDGFGNDTPYVSVVSCPSDKLCVTADQNSHTVATSTNPDGGAAAWTVTRLDSSDARRTGGAGITGMSCPTSDLCVAVDSGGNVLTSRNPTGGATAWTVTHVDGPLVCFKGEGTPPCGLMAVSCPSTTLCVAVDAVGNVVASRNPTGGAAAWTVSKVYGDDFARRVSCPSISLCFALGGYAGGDMRITTQPTGGAAGWKVIHLTNNANLSEISCPSVSLCFAVDDHGNVIHSANPTGGAGTWTGVHADPDPVAEANGVGAYLSGLSCPSSTLCVAVDSANVVTSTNPTGGPADWTVANVDSANDVQGVSCPSVSLCVAVDHFGNVATSTNPTGGPSAWTVTNLGGIGVSSLFRVSCPSSVLCVAVGEQRLVDWAYPILVTSANPTGGPAAWKVIRVVDPGVVGVSCPSITLCVAADGNDVYTSTNPTGNSAKWTLAHLTTGSNLLTDVSCPTVGLCVALDSSGNVFTSSRPTGGATTWKKVARASVSNFGAMLSCPSTHLCVALANDGEVMSGDPSGGSATWKVAQMGGNHSLTGMSCPSVNLCVAVGYGGNVLTTINPTGGAVAWKSIHVIGTNFLIGVSCPTVSLCVAVESAGTVVIGTSQP